MNITGIGAPRITMQEKV